MDVRHLNRRAMLRLGAAGGALAGAVGGYLVARGSAAARAAPGTTAANAYVP